MNRREVINWLRETDHQKLNQLWIRADAVRRQHVGDDVHLRGLVEISNHCCRLCTYCGLRGPNRTVARYRMTPEAVLACARHAVELELGTVVLQAGEDHSLSTGLIADIIRRIKDETGRAVTLSLGERGRDELAIWRAAGADRYLLRFETSNQSLYREIHPDPPGQHISRVALLEHL
ncbi:MAG: [FeFe] hydrogenase H-cluster radical SAM maturase HydE, partial [Phycisphaerae bacterium]|nr:[FeFe] hydrogenase H-cluster radical SAM maturase HydE [Phycisphaerae bacterium]